MTGIMRAFQAITQAAQRSHSPILLSLVVRRGCSLRQMSSGAFAPANDGFRLRPYQLECVQTCINQFQQGVRRQVSRGHKHVPILNILGLVSVIRFSQLVNSANSKNLKSLVISIPISSQKVVSLPVGSGKTVIMSYLVSQLASIQIYPAHRLRARKFLVLAHREELLQQASHKISSLNPKLAVSIYDKSLRSLDTVDVVVASVPMLGRFACTIFIVESSPFCDDT